VEVAKRVAVLFSKLTLLAPEFVSVIAPVKLLVTVFNVIAFAPAVKLEVPGTVSAPFCVMAPPVAPSIAAGQGRSKTEACSPW